MNLKIGYNRRAIEAFNVVIWLRYCFVTSEDRNAGIIASME